MFVCQEGTSYKSQMSNELMNSTLVNMAQGFVICEMRISLRPMREVRQIESPI